LFQTALMSGLWVTICNYSALTPAPLPAWERGKIPSPNLGQGKGWGLYSYSYDYFFDQLLGYSALKPELWEQFFLRTKGYGCYIF
jgi:hypothetical protein